MRVQIMKKYALGIDFGTQSVRCIIFDDKGETVCLYKKSYPNVYYSKKPGYAEQNPDVYLNAFYEVCKKMCAEHPDVISQTLGASISCFRDTAVLLDKDYNLIRDSILWLDQRRAKCNSKLPLKTRFALRLVGMYETADLNRKRTISNWLEENEKDNWDKVVHYWNISTYIIYKLTGKAIDTPSSYTGHYPINTKKKRWQKKGELTYPIFNIDIKKCPELTTPGSLLGEINKEASAKTGLPVGFKIYGGGGDKSLETLGVGAIDDTIASISYGTACSIEIFTKKYREPETFLPAYTAPIPFGWNMEIQVYRGYWMLEWFAKNFATEELNVADIEKVAVEELLNQKMLAIPPGSEGLVLQPYWGPGLKRPLAKGAIVGFSDYHTKYHLYRAIIEGIAYALKEGLIGMEKKRHSGRIKKIRVSGGGSKSKAICQITSDIFNLPVSKIQTYETSSLGAAIIVFVSSSSYSSYQEAIKNMVHENEVYTPNPENVKIYKKIFSEVYEKIYPRLKNINLAIRRVTSSSEGEN